MTASTGGEDSPLAQTRHNVAEVTRIIVLRRQAFFVPFCLAATLAAVISHQIPRKYKASTAFERRENPVLNDLPDGSSIRIVKDSRSTLLRELHSVDLMEEVVDTLGLTKDLPRDPQTGLTESARAQRRARRRRRDSEGPALR